MQGLITLFIIGVGIFILIVAVKSILGGSGTGYSRNRMRDTYDDGDRDGSSLFNRSRTRYPSRSENDYERGPDMGYSLDDQPREGFGDYPDPEAASGGFGGHETSKSGGGYSRPSPHVYENKPSPRPSSFGSSSKSGGFSSGGSRGSGSKSGGSSSFKSSPPSKKK